MEREVECLSKTEVIIIAGIYPSFFVGWYFEEKKYYVYLACSVLVTFMSAIVPSLIDVWYEETLQNDNNDYREGETEEDVEENNTG